MAPAPPALTLQEQKAPQSVGAPSHEVQTESPPRSTWGGGRVSPELKPPTLDFPTGRPSKIENGEQFEFLVDTGTIHLLLKLIQGC